MKELEELTVKRNLSIVTLKLTICYLRHSVSLLMKCNGNLAWLLGMQLNKGE